MDFEERLNRARENTNANCWGTAYFLSGASDQLVDTPDKDWPMKHEGSKAYWNGLKVLDRPTIRCYAGIIGPAPKKLNLANEEFLYHLGIVTDIYPIRITHRNGDQGPLIEDETLTKLLEENVIDQRLRVEFRAFKN